MHSRQILSFPLLVAKQTAEFRVSGHSSTTRDVENLFWHHSKWYKRQWHATKHLHIIIALRIARSAIASCRFASTNHFCGTLGELDMFFCVSVRFLGEQIAKAHLVLSKLVKFTQLDHHCKPQVHC